MAKRNNAQGVDAISYNNLDDAVQGILLAEVAPVVEEILRRHIQTDIYDAYTPKEGAWVDGQTYERRHVLEDAITSEIIDGGTLFVTSVAAANDSVVRGYEFSNDHPGAFLELLESGNMGIWRGGFARPAVTNAQSEVDGSAEIRMLIENGVRRELQMAARTSR